MRYLALLAGLLMLGPSMGCKAMLYPMARAFGGPSEAELKHCRAAFNRMKVGFRTVPVVVFPAVVPMSPGGTPLAGSDTLLLGGLRKGGVAQALGAKVTPEVASSPLGHNQMRYAWDRARAYGAWVKRAHPEGEYLVFTEILQSKDGAIHGMMVYVTEGSGQIAYLSLWNSHHFAQGKAPRDVAAACDLIVTRLLAALNQEATVLFPPYGVG